jgi:hypothetical protein
VRRTAVPKAVKEEVWCRAFGLGSATGHCDACDKEIHILSFHAGHVVANSEGGRAVVDNLVPLCASCNLSQGSRNLKEFKDELGAPKREALRRDLLAFAQVFLRHVVTSGSSSQGAREMMEELVARLESSPRRQITEDDLNLAKALGFGCLAASPPPTPSLAAAPTLSLHARVAAGPADTWPSASAADLQFGEEMRQNPAWGGAWPYCTLCGKWSGEEHRKSGRHEKKMACASPQKPDEVSGLVPCSGRDGAECPNWAWVCRGRCRSCRR